MVVREDDLIFVNTGYNARIKTRNRNQLKESKPVLLKYQFAPFSI